MKTIATIHGKPYREQGRLKIQVKFADGIDGCVSGQTRSGLRKSLSIRGVSEAELLAIFDETKRS